MSAQASKAAREIVINREWHSSFIAGEMRLALKGTCTIEDLQDAEKVLEIALQQIRRVIVAEE